MQKFQFKYIGAAHPAYTETILASGVDDARWILALRLTRDAEWDFIGGTLTNFYLYVREHFVVTEIES